MPEIKNTFLKGRMNKDLDERLIPNGEYRDALNITVSTSEDSDVGAAQTLLGNVRIEDIIPTDFICVGSIANEKNNRLYWFIKNQATGVDAIIEHEIGLAGRDSFNNIVFVDRFANTDNPVLRFPPTIITGINIIDDLLFWTDGEGEPKKININNCKRGTVQDAIALTQPIHTKLFVLNDDLGDIQEEDITVIKKKPTNAPIAIPRFTKLDQAVYNTKTSLFEKVFSRFAFRYKYQDNEYSAFGPFSNVVFNPEYVSNPHKTSSSDGFVNYDNNNSYSIKEPFNATMVNKIDTIDIYNFVAADIPRGVVEVEILYKQENSPVIYSIATLNKKDTEGYWDLNGFNEGSSVSSSEYKGKYTIVTENIYAALPENQFIRVFDTVPKKALAQEITGNRLVYANYTQGYDVDVNSIQIVADYETRINNTTFDFSPQRSLKSLRNYQVGVVFGDEHGRETPVFTYSEAAVSIPWQNGSGDYNASSSLSLKAQITSEYPSFASYFKFYIKETSTEYYNLIMDKAYIPTSQDDQDRSIAPDHIWISFFSSDRSKIDIEDHLILKKILNESIDGQETNNNKFKIIDIVNEAPESISYEFHDLAGISNDTGNLTSILDESNFSIIDETDTLVVDYSNFHNLTVGAGGILGPREGFEDEKTANTQDMFVSWYKLNSDGSKEYSKDYRVRSIFTTDTTSYRIKLQKKITSDDATLADNGSGVIDSNIIFNVFRKQRKELDQFSGRFFVKIIFDYVVNGVRDIIEDVTQNYRAVASAKMKYWLNEVDNTNRDEKNKIVNVSPSATSYDSAADATINGQVLHTGITDTQAKWNALYLHVTSGGTTEAFFIDNMYFAAGQARMSQRYARYAQDVIIGQSVGSYGSFYTYPEWTNTLSIPVSTNHWFLTSMPFSTNNYGPNVSYNYFDYVKLDTMTGSVITPSNNRDFRFGYTGTDVGVGNDTDGPDFTTAITAAQINNSWPASSGSFPTVGGIQNLNSNYYAPPNAINPTYRWYPFAKDASVGYYFIGGNTPPAQPVGQSILPAPFGYAAAGAYNNTASININHPDVTSNPDWSDWDNYIIPVRTSAAVGSTDPGISTKDFDPTKILNSMEGIFVSTTDHVNGYKSWIDFPQNGVNPTSSVIYDNDNTYKSSAGKVFMHLSFLGPGKDLVPDNLDLTNADITGPNCIGAYLQGIHGGGVFTKERKDGLDNGWAFGTEWNSPQVIECESNSSPPTFDSNLDIGYDSNYQNLHDTQWQPVENINGDPNGKIQEFLFELFFPRSRFRFKDDSGNIIYTIKSITKKFLYNHTPWKRRYVKKSSYTSNSIFSAPSDFRDHTNMEPAGDSVEEFAVAWAKAKADNAADLATKTDELETKIKNFGKANNRRVVYILELVDENDNPLNPIAQTYNPVDADSGGSGIVAENSTAQMDFVNYAPGIARGKVSNNPAIWETEPRENKNLEVYYEASSAIPTKLNVDTAELYAPVGCRVEALNRPGSLDGQITLSECNITGYSENVDGRLILETTGFNANDAAGSSIVYADPDPISGTTCMLKCIRDDGSYTMFLAVDSTIDQPAGLVSQFVVISQRGFDFGLNWYNCFSFGNGIESNRIRDEFNKMQIINGARASAVLEEPYAEETRKHGLIYSGIYNSTSSVNNLNQFVIGDKITKDLNPTYGSIQKLFQRRVSLVAFCEDRVVSIVSNKDALFNADGKPQLISSTNVLGDATPFVGNYGISKNPESFASESYRAYFTDQARGAVLRLSKDGITPISNAGMKDWFRDNLPLFNNLIGSYDSYNDDYNITLQNTENVGLNLIANSFLDEGVAPLTGLDPTSNPETIENPNFNNSTNSTWPLDLSDATVPQIVTQDTPSVTVYINEYEPIPQGYFQVADNSSTTPGDGLPGDPGQVGNPSTPPNYAVQNFQDFDTGPAHIYRLRMSSVGTTPHPDLNPFDTAKTGSYAGDSFTLGYGGSETMYFLRFNEQYTSNGHLGGQYEIADTNQNYNRVNRPYDGPATTVNNSTSITSWGSAEGNVFYDTSFAGQGLTYQFGFNTHAKDYRGVATTIEDVITFGYNDHIPNSKLRGWFNNLGYGMDANQLGVFTKVNGVFPTTSGRQSAVESTYSGTDGSVYSGEHIVVDIAYIIHLGNVYLYDYDPSAPGAPPNGYALSGTQVNVPAHDSQSSTDWKGFVGTGDTLGEIKDDNGVVFVPSKSTPLPNQGQSIVNTNWRYKNFYDDVTDPSNPVNVANNTYHTPFSLPFHHQVRLYLFDGTTSIDSDMIDDVDGLNDTNDNWTDGNGNLNSWVNTYQKDDGGSLVDGEHYSTYMTSSQADFTPTIYKVYGDHNQYGVVKMKVKIPIKDWFDPDDPSNTSSPTSMQTSLSNMKMIDQLGVKLKFNPCDHDGTASGVNTRNKIYLYRFNVAKQKYAGSVPINYVETYPPVPELFDVPSAPVPGFATVAYQLLDWYNFLPFSDLDTGFGTYGPMLPPGSDSDNGGGSTTYSWYTPPATVVDPNSYTASDVAAIYSLTAGGNMQSTVGGSPGGFQMADHLNVDQTLSPQPFSDAQIALSPYGGKEFEADHYYLLDIIYDETTSPTGKIFISGIFDKNNPPAGGLAPGDSGYISGHFGITKDFGGSYGIYDALELQQVDRTTDVLGQFNYIAGQSGEDSNVFRAIFKVDSNSRIMTNAHPHKTTEMNLVFEDYIGKIKKVVLKNIGSYDLWNNGNGYPANTSVDLASLGQVVYSQGWFGHYGAGVPNTNPMYHAMSLPVQYIKNNEIHINNGPQAQYSDENTLWTTGRSYARWVMGKHANAQNNYAVAHNMASNPIEAPQPTFDGYEIIFEVGNEYYTNTMDTLKFLYRSYDNTTEERKGFLVENIDTPGTYRVIANFDGNTTLPNGDLWSIELDTGSGFEEISTTSSNATISVSNGNTGTATSWNNYYGNYIFYIQGSAMVCSIKSLSVTDRTTYVNTNAISSADDWVFHGFEPTFNEQNIIWDNGTILINSNNSATSTFSGTFFPFVSAFQALPDFNLGDFYRLRFDYVELNDNQSPLIIYYYNSSGEGFEVQVPSGSGNYDEILTIGSSTSTEPYQANVNNIVIIPSDSVNISNYTIDNIFLQRAFMPPGTEPITVSFSEDVKGWVSFKSFIPEQALSLSKKYFSISSGALYQHNILPPESVYNNFYGVQYDSSITAVLNADPSIVKSFKTLNYEGTQAKVDQYEDIEIDGFSYQDINNNLTSGDIYGTYHNIIDKNGWYVDNIITNKQEGFVNEFLEKEGKWFNYIRGTRQNGNLGQDYISQHTGDLSFQGISVISGAEAVPVPSGDRLGGGNGNGNGNGTEGSTPPPTGGGGTNGGGGSGGGY